MTNLGYLLIGIGLGLLIQVAHRAWRTRKDLPPVPGKCVVTRKDGSQHYRDLPKRLTTGEAS